MSGSERVPWTAARLDGLVVTEPVDARGDRAAGAPLLRLAPGRAAGALEATLPDRGAWDRAVPSLGALPWPTGARARVRLRARVGGRWTPWAPLGVHGGGPDHPRSEVGPDPAEAEVDVDTLKLPRAGAEAELRVEVEADDAAAARAVGLTRLSLARWLDADGPTPAPGAGAEPEEARAAWGRELAVPERSQRVEDPAIAGRICSPTSLAMVLAFHGHDLPTARVAAAVHDRGADLYGNWSFNVAFAASLGLEAEVVRCRAWAPVEDEVAAGRPVVLTHRYRPGEVAGAAIDGTAGHLIVLRGFDGQGDPIVNDPAADPRRGAPIRRVYRRADLTRSWLGNARGVAYRVQPPG